ncbi:mCG145982, partial [Mus musculus]
SLLPGALGQCQRSTTWRHVSVALQPKLTCRSSSEARLDTAIRYLEPPLKRQGINFKMIILRAGNMTQWVRALTALMKVLNSNPSNMVAHNHPK